MIRCSTYITIYNSSVAHASSRGIAPFLCLVGFIVIFNADYCVRSLGSTQFDIDLWERKQHIRTSNTESASRSVLLSEAYTAANSRRNGNIYNQTTSTAQNLASVMTIDILSVGSHTRPAYLEAQLETFGSHSSVRDFVQATEDVDTDATCPSELTWSSLIGIVLFCRGHHPSQIIPQKQHRDDENQPVNASFTSEQRKRFVPLHKLLKKSNPKGWLCAQKRPLEAFVEYMQRYKRRGDQLSNRQSFDASTTSRLDVATRRQLEVDMEDDDLPDYLFIIDDDTYINMPLVTSQLYARFPSRERHAVSGRLLGSHKYYPYPVGGLGNIFSRRVLQHFLTPVYCNDESSTEESSSSLPGAISDDFNAHVCHQVAQNLIGEVSIFRNGMSVVDLLQAYITRFRYTEFQHWTSPGYCMHSDWVWGYFFRAYQLAGPSGGLRPYDARMPMNGESHRKSPYDNTMHDNTKSQCTVNSHLCHYAGPEQMRILHEQSI